MSFWSPTLYLPYRRSRLYSSWEQRLATNMYKCSYAQAKDVYIFPRILVECLGLFHGHLQVGMWVILATNLYLAWKEPSSWFVSWDLCNRICNKPQMTFHDFHTGSCRLCWWSMRQTLWHWISKLQGKEGGYEFPEPFSPGNTNSGPPRIDRQFTHWVAISSLLPFTLGP